MTKIDLASGELDPRNFSRELQFCCFVELCLLFVKESLNMSKTTSA